MYLLPSLEGNQHHFSDTEEVQQMVFLSNSTGRVKTEAQRVPTNQRKL